jgi:hypothetical protein
MDREVASVPKLRIGEGAKPGANDSTKHINPVPTITGAARGTQPKACAMESEVNSVKKGNAGGSSKSVGGWNQRRKKK